MDRELHLRIHQYNASLVLEKHSATEITIFQAIRKLKKLHLNRYGQLKETYTLGERKKSIYLW